MEKLSVYKVLETLPQSMALTYLLLGKMEDDIHYCKDTANVSEITSFYSKLIKDLTLYTKSDEKGQRAEISKMFSEVSQVLSDKQEKEQEKEGGKKEDREEKSVTKHVKLDIINIMNTADNPDGDEFQDRLGKWSSDVEDDKESDLSSGDEVSGKLKTI